MELDWITPRQAAVKWGLTERHTQSLCQNGKIAGVIRLGRSWLIPKDATKPIDGRTKAAKNDKHRTKRTGGD
jgi:excisionase family DNA binding protein